MDAPLQIREGLAIPSSELEWKAVRSSGPGGQNVNKVSSKIDLRFAFRTSAALPPEVKDRLAVIALHRLDGEGRIQVVSQVTRDQLRNLEDARETLASLIRQALVRPKTRRPTRPSRAAKRRRVESKRKHSEKKKRRREGWGE